MFDSICPAPAAPSGAATGELPRQPPGPPPSLVGEELQTFRSPEPKRRGSALPGSVQESEDTDGPGGRAEHGGPRDEAQGQALHHDHQDGAVALQQAQAEDAPVVPQQEKTPNRGLLNRGVSSASNLAEGDASGCDDDGWRRVATATSSRQDEEDEKPKLKLRANRSFLALDRKDTLTRMMDSGIVNEWECRATGAERWAARRLQLWIFLEEPFETLPSAVFSSLMVLTIFVSVTYSVASCTESNVDGEFELDNSWANFCFNLIFVLDILLRFIAFPNHRGFLKQARNVSDIACVLPFLINDVLASLLGSIADTEPDAFRLLWLAPYEAFLRLLKLSRYFWGWNLLYHAISQSVQALVIPLFFILLVSLFGSCTLYVFESLSHNGDPSTAHDFGEEHFVPITNLPDAIHFVVIVILSVSAGPFYGLQAASTVGQMIVVLLMFVGIIFMAMPIAITGSCFSQTWFDQERIVLLDQIRSRLQAQGYSQEDLQMVFEEVDQDRSGAIEFEEFRQMIETFNLRSLNAAKIRKLFQTFDNDGDGEINFVDFSLALFPDIPVEIQPGGGPAGPGSEEREDGDGVGILQSSDRGNKSRTSMFSRRSTADTGIAVGKARSEPAKFDWRSSLHSVFSGRRSDDPQKPAKVGWTSSLHSVFSGRRSDDPQKLQQQQRQRRKSTSRDLRRQRLLQAIRRRGSAPGIGPRDSQPEEQLQERRSDGSADHTPPVSPGLRSTLSQGSMQSLGSPRRKRCERQQAEAQREGTGSQRTTPASAAAAAANDGGDSATGSRSRPSLPMGDSDTSAAWVATTTSGSLETSERLRAPRPPPLQEENALSGDDHASLMHTHGSAGSQGGIASELSEGAFAVVHSMDGSSGLNGQEVLVMRRSSRQGDTWLVHMPDGGRKRLPANNLRPSPVASGSRVAGLLISRETSINSISPGQHSGSIGTAGNGSPSNARASRRRDKESRHGAPAGDDGALKRTEDILVRLEKRMKRRLDGLTLGMGP